MDNITELKYYRASEHKNVEDSNNFSKIKESSLNSKPNIDDIFAKATAIKISGVASGYIPPSLNNSTSNNSTSLKAIHPISSFILNGEIRQSTDNVKFTQINNKSDILHFNGIELDVAEEKMFKFSPQNLLMSEYINGELKFTPVERNSKEAKEYLAKGNKFSVIVGDTIQAPKGSPLLGQETAKYNGKVFNTQEQSDDIASAVQEQAEEYILQQSIIEAKPEKKDFPSYTRERTSAVPVYVAVKAVTPNETTHFVTDLSGLITTLMKETHSKNWIEEEHNKEYADNKEIKMKNVLVKCICILNMSLERIKLPKSTDLSKSRTLNGTQKT